MVHAGHKGRRGGQSVRIALLGVAALLGGAGWLACTSPGSGDSDPPDDADPSLALSASKVAAAQFFSIEHPSIQAGDLVQVRFRQLDGVEMMFESQEAEAGMVRIPAPPVVDDVTGLRGGVFQVSIEGVDEELSLEVEPLPDLDDLPPGAILDMLLNSAIEDLFDTETTLRDEPDEYGMVSQTQATLFAMTQERRRLEDMHIQLVLNGSLEVAVSEDETVTLGESDLRTLDQYLAAQIMSLYEEVVLADPLAARTVNEDCITQIRNGTLKGEQAIRECVDGILIGVKGAAVRAAQVAQAPANLIAISFTIAGVVFKAPLIILTGVLVAGGNAVWSYATASAAQENTDAFLLRRGEDFNSSKEALSQLTRNGTNLLGSAPGPTGLVFSAVSVATSVKDLNAAVQAARCEEGQPNQRITQSADDVAFCSIVTPIDDDDGPTLPPGVPVTDCSDENCDLCVLGTSLEGNCPDRFNGAGDGCDCGCQFVDSDCTPDDAPTEVVGDATEAVCLAGFTVNVSGDAVPALRDVALDSFVQFSTYHGECQYIRADGLNPNSRWGLNIRWRPASEGTPNGACGMSEQGAIVSKDCCTRASTQRTVEVSYVLSTPIVDANAESARNEVLDEFLSNAVQAGVGAACP